MKNKKIAIDTNVLIYTRDRADSSKYRKALDILDMAPVVSSQVALEYMNVVRRLFKITKKECMSVCLSDIEDCAFHPVAFSTLRLAESLVISYDFQLFDSIVVASALETDCKILYSEDFQHGQIIEKQLKIVNPFL
ncbi:MAG: PIN domain-containing protein [Proteiniphilum sp.]